MKKTLSILLTLTMLVSLSVPAFAATTDTTNSGYVVVTEDFSAVTNHNKVSKDVNGGTDVTSIGNQFYKNSKTNVIGGSDWIFKANTASYNLSHADAYVGEDGKLYVNGGGSGFASYPDRRASVYYNGDYSKVGNNFKITFDFNKSVNVGTCVKFMLSENVANYYALNMETGANSKVWNLYKVEDNVITTLASSPETIGSSAENKDGTGGTDAGTITVVYDNGKISWDIVANRFSGEDMEYHNTGSYTDPNPFNALPSECKIGFSTNNTNFGAFAKIDNVKFSYSVPCIAEDFNSFTTASGIANTAEVKETQITGTDFWLDSKSTPLDAKLTATAADVIAYSGVKTTGLRLQYDNASLFSHYRQMDFAEYRGDCSGLGDDYTISFDYYSNFARNSAYFLFGAAADNDGKLIYDDYYVFMINGLAEANRYNGASVTDIPSWEIRRVQGEDTLVDVYAQSENEFDYDAAANSGVSGYKNLTGKGTTAANVTLTVKNGVATVTVLGKIGTTETYRDTESFDVSTIAGNHFAFSSGSEKTAAFYDNILVEANDDPVEYKDGKVYIVGGKFASRGGVALFALNDGTYRIENVTMNTHEKKVMNVPENATKMFFWRDFSTVRPLVASIEF